MAAIVTPATAHTDRICTARCDDAVGEALAYAVARTGARLVLSARREQELQRVRDRCLQCGPLSSDAVCRGRCCCRGCRASRLGDAQILLLPFDAAACEQHPAVVERALAAFGRIDVLGTRRSVGTVSLR